MSFLGSIIFLTLTPKENCPHFSPKKPKEIKCKYYFFKNQKIKVIHKDLYSYIFRTWNT